MPVFRSDGHQLAYAETGSGPPLVLIHGWGASGTEWEEFGWVSRLQGRFRLLMPDVRGHGASGKPHGVEAYGMLALAGDVGALLDHVGTESACVFGYSMGGAIALWTAALHPQRVVRLVVGGTSGAGPAQTAALGRALGSAEPADPRVRAYHEYAVRSPANDLRALAACLATGLPAPACRDLAGFRGPVLLAAGDQDRHHAFTEHLAGCLANARFLSIPGADHMGAFGDQRLHKAVVAFLEETA